MADRKPLVSVDGRTKELPSGDRINAGLISDFASTVRSTLLTGLSTATNAAIAATDTVLQALGKLQAQVSGKANLAGINNFTGLNRFDAVRANVPSNFWETQETAIFPDSGGSGGGIGFLGTNGGFALSLVCNGYRNNSGGFTSFGNGGFSTASAVDLMPNGTIVMRSGTPSGISVPLLLQIGSNQVIPGTDNTVNIGHASFRFKEIFCANGTINTSDAREKTTPRHLTPDELAAALDIARLPCIFQWLAAVEEKGEAARLHASPTVQDVIAAMEAHGLDPMRYGFVCYDEWDEQPEVTETEPAEYDDEGNLIREEQTVVVQECQPAGNRYSLRPSELAHFIQSAIVQEQDSIKARLAVLETAA